MTTITIPAHIYHTLIEQFTTRTQQMMHPDRGERLPDGNIRFELQPIAELLLRPYLLDNESYEEAIMRIIETAGRKPS